jgi:competence protein CoiA
MPLTAIVDGKTVFGPDLSKEEWADLALRHKKGLPVRMACCGAPGHVRRSKKGTRHFYHAVNTGCHYAEESPEHLAIKYQIYRICRSEQWEARVEFPAPDRSWISDVYAVRHGRKVVFEIQTSGISPDDLEGRDSRYRNEGIESYWLLENFPERSGDFAPWYDSLNDDDDHLRGQVPYIDDSIFDAGPENRIFMAKGIRTVGLSAKKQSLYTTDRPKISLPDWVRQVLNGEYHDYLESNAAFLRRKRRLTILAAPALIRFREFYLTIVRNETYRKEADRLYRTFRNRETLIGKSAVQKRFDEINSELDWLEKEYRTFTSVSSGLFSWKKSPGKERPQLVFRLESELGINQLKECVSMLSRWEDSFHRALGSLERETRARKP